MRPRGFFDKYILTLSNSPCLSVTLPYTHSHAHTCSTYTGSGRFLPSWQFTVLWMCHASSIRFWAQQLSDVLSLEKIQVQQKDCVTKSCCYCTERDSYMNSRTVFDSQSGWEVWIQQYCVNVLWHNKCIKHGSADSLLAQLCYFYLEVLFRKGHTCH